MKATKWISALLAATVLVTAAIPMASAEAADFNVNLQEDYIFVPEPETVSASFGDDGSVTLTLLEDGISGSGRFMMWNDVEDPFVNLAETPYLCWEVTGANFGFAVRWDENVDDSTCYRMQNARGHADDGVAPEKMSINLLDLLKNNDLGLVYNGDEIVMVATALNVYGNAGDSATFKIWFSATPVDSELNASEQTGTNPAVEPTAADDDNTTAAPAGTTKKANPSTGEGAQAAVAALVLATSAAAVLFAVKQKKNG